MLAIASRLAFVTAAAVALVTTGVNAEAIDPRCAKIKDKVRCHCWFANGAQFVYIPGAKTPRIGASNSDIERITACMRRFGRS